MGSRSKNNLAYIAGFLDGDGSLMLQIKNRKDGRSKIRFMPTICFYQDSRHSEPLKWIRDALGIGYLSKRNDGMSELRINGYEQIKKILLDLQPFIRFKKTQTKLLLEGVNILSERTISELSKEQLDRMVHIILGIQNENYVTKRKKTKKELEMVLGLTP